MIDRQMTWRARVQDLSLGHKANDLTPTVKSVFAELLPGYSIDLRNLNPINPVQLAVVLRATFSRQQICPGWNEALELCKVACTRDNLDVQDVLYGLMKPYAEN